MKRLEHYFADQLVEKAQDVANLYVSLCDNRRLETTSGLAEQRREATEDTILRQLYEAFGWYIIASTAFCDRIVAEIVEIPDAGQASSDPPWDF